MIDQVEMGKVTSMTQGEDIGTSLLVECYKIEVIKERQTTKLITKNCGNIGDGFIVLSEILLILHLNKFKIDETETIFINRKRGESSVNLNLIIQSLFGLIRLFFIKRNYKS